MEKWWVVLLFSYLLPLLQISIAAFMKIFRPKYQNGAFGFYSARSASNEKLWDMAQKKFTQYSFQCGLGVLAIVLGLHIIPASVTVVNITSAILGLLSFVFVYLLVERYLKKQKI